MKQLALLLPGPLAREPELEKSESAGIIASYALLFHPRLLAGAHFLPEIEDIIDPPQGNERVLVIAEHHLQQADPAVRAEIEKQSPESATTLIVRPRDQVWQPITWARRLGWPVEDEPLVREFFAAGYHYLGLQVLLRKLGHSQKIEENLIWSEWSQAAEAFVAGDFENARNALHAGFDVMHGNRQSAYPATINWLDIALMTHESTTDSLSERISVPVKFNLIATPSQLDSLPVEVLEDLKKNLSNDDVEILGGRMTHRPMGLLPIESRAWELQQSFEQFKQILQREVDCYAGRAGSLAWDLPQLLMKFNVRYAMHAAFDGSRFPLLRGPKIHWSTPDGSIIETVTRPPLNASDESGGLSLFQSLAEVLNGERSPTTILAHPLGKEADWYRMLLEGQKIATVFGKFETFTEYFLHVMMPEGPTVTRPDEYGLPKASWQEPDSVSRPRDHVWNRHRFDALRSALGLASVASRKTPVDEERLAQLEECVETESSSRVVEEALDQWEIDVRSAIANAWRGETRGKDGFLIVNPSSFPRRLGIELPGRLEAPTLDATLRACEATAEGSRVIVDLPGWSYAWIPKQGNGTEKHEPLEVVASGRRLRNTQIEVEIDKRTGGVRGIWSIRDRYSRLGQQLVASVGSEMVAQEIRVTCSGTVMGEITSTGIIRHLETKRTLATFVQRVRVWRGRPVARIDFHLDPLRDARASWCHQEDSSYLGCRWSWPDDKTVLLTASGTQMGSHQQDELEATDFLELREQHLTSNIVTGGLVRTVRPSPVQADTVLITPTESKRDFSLWVGLDLPNPFRFAQAELWPPIVVPTHEGPPPSGPTGTVLELASDTVHALSLAPTTLPNRGVRIRLAETMARSGRSVLRFQERPESVLLTNFRGETIYDLYREENQVSLDLSAFELQQLLVQWPNEVPPSSL